MKLLVRKNVSKWRVSVLLIAVLFSSLLSFAGQDFPLGPDLQTTPGSLCKNSNVRRYPARIIYCERDVSSDLKRQLIKNYDEQLGFHIRQMNRQDFKIDHFIPLSIGGSNESNNLWPQHKTVYGITDPLEQLLSDKISANKITQSEAVRVIKEAKLNLGRVPELIDYVESMR